MGPVTFEEKVAEILMPYRYDGMDDLGEVVDEITNLHEAEIKEKDKQIEILQADFAKVLKGDYVKPK